MPASFAYLKPGQWGLVQKGLISPLREKLYSTAELIEYLDHQPLQEILRKPKSMVEPEREWTKPLLCPITQPCQVVCQGKNYLDHLKEMGTKPEDKTFNLFFMKAASALTSADHSVLEPSVTTTLLDYELELGLVIRGRISRPVKVGLQDLSKWVAGLVIANDVSARDIQLRQGQWFKGKSYRGFCPVGPYFLYFGKKEPLDVRPLQLELRVNGELRQSASAEQMMYAPHQTLAEMTALMDFYPGDLILTGTPAGVAFKAPATLPPDLKTDREKTDFTIRHQTEDASIARRYLKPGDRLEATILHSKLPWDLGRHAWSLKTLSP